MTDSERKKVIDKIEKILRLANNAGTAAEAAAAAEMASSLLVKYQIEESEINLDSDQNSGPEILNKVTPIPRASKRHKWMVSFALAVQNFTSTKFLVYSNVFVIYGTEASVDVAISMINFLADSMESSANKRYREHKAKGYSTRGFLSSYRSAYVREIIGRSHDFINMAQAEQEKYALVRTTMIQKITEAMPPTTEVPVKTAAQRHNSHGLAAGRKDAQDLRLNKELSS